MNFILSILLPSDLRNVVVCSPGVWNPKMKLGRPFCRVSLTCVVYHRVSTVAMKSSSNTPGVWLFFLFFFSTLVNNRLCCGLVLTLQLQKECCQYPERVGIITGNDLSIRFHLVTPLSPNGCSVLATSQ